MIKKVYLLSLGLRRYFEVKIRTANIDNKWGTPLFEIGTKSEGNHGKTRIYSKLDDR